jgi:hypothetical protein
VPAATDWGRNVGEVFARLATEIDEIGTGPEVRFGMLYVAATELLRRIRPADSRINKDDEDMLSGLVTFTAQKLRRERSGIFEGLPEE